MSQINKEDVLKIIDEDIEAVDICLKFAKEGDFPDETLREKFKTAMGFEKVNLLTLRRKIENL